MSEIERESFMIVDLEEKEESGSFELKGGGKVYLKLRNEADEKEIRAACVKLVVEYPLLDGKYQRFESEKTDMTLFVEMCWDKNITGWDDLFDCKEKPIPVTKENKILLMKMVPLFRETVEKGLQALKEVETARAEAAEKNLLNG